MHNFRLLYENFECVFFPCYIMNMSKYAGKGMTFIYFLLMKNNSFPFLHILTLWYHCWNLSRSNILSTLEKKIKHQSEAISIPQLPTAYWPDGTSIPHKYGVVGEGGGSNCVSIYLAFIKTGSKFYASLQPIGTLLFFEFGTSYEQNILH